MKKNFKEIFKKRKRKGWLRTFELILAVPIVAFIVLFAAYLAPTPSPQQYTTVQLKGFALSTLSKLNQRGYLTHAVYNEDWLGLKKELDTSFPPNIIYNFTVYRYQEINKTVRLGEKIKEVRLVKVGQITNFKGVNKPKWAESVNYHVSTAQVTFTVETQKSNKTIYLLGCTDAPGWWITGYTPHSLAILMKNYLDPYFTNVTIINDTDQLENLFLNPPNGTIIINCHGVAVPIPSNYVSGNLPNWQSYMQDIRAGIINHNWTWVNIVGYPFTYVSNRNYDNCNDWVCVWGWIVQLLTGGDISGEWDCHCWTWWGVTGLYGIGPPGLSIVVTGSSSTDSRISDIGVVNATQLGLETMNTYGIQYSPNQSFSRALDRSWMESNGWQVQLETFEERNGYCSAAVFNRSNSSGKLINIGLSRPPEPRVPVVTLLALTHPKLEQRIASIEQDLRVIVLQLTYISGG